MSKKEPFHEIRSQENTVILEKSEVVELKGKKDDQKKPMMSLLPPAGLNEVSKVLTFGANKYGAHNWRRGLTYSRLVSATMRHLNSWNSGTDIDPESGISHLAHAACNLLMLIEYEKLGLGKDDRWRKE